MRLFPKQPGVRDDRWVPLAGPTSQRASAGYRRHARGGWAAAWLASGGVLAHAGGADARGVVGRGERKPAQKGEKAFSSFLFFSSCKTEILNYFQCIFQNKFESILRNYFGICF